MSDIEFLGVIPARGGSKRVPGKNIKKLYGKPLIYWSILAAKKSKYLDDFVVSTEDIEIARIAKRYGTKVLERPVELARDDISVFPVLKHALEHIEAKNVVLLQPTSPIRVNGIIDKCIRTFKHLEPDSLATGYICKCYEWTKMPNMPSQEMKGWFYNDGCVEIHSADVILSNRHWGDKRIRFIVPEIYNHEIDTWLDFIKVEAVMRYLDKEGLLKWDEDGTI